MKQILVFGNPLIKEDSFAIEIAKELSIPGIKFIISDSFNNILDYNKKEITILDVIKDIKKPIIIDNLDKLKESKSLTLHDFDLLFNLKLLKEIGKIKDIKIIGIPQEGDKEEIKKEIATLLNE